MQLPPAALIFFQCRTLAQLVDGSSGNRWFPAVRNDFRKTGYNGPCPPTGKPRRYYFRLFVLDTTLELKPGTARKELEAAMKEHILAHVEWMGRYGRWEAPHRKRAQK